MTSVVWSSPRKSVVLLPFERVTRWKSIPQTAAFFSASTNSPLKPRRLPPRSGLKITRSPCVPPLLSSALRTKPLLVRLSATIPVKLERQQLPQKILLSPLSVWLSPFVEPLADLFRRNCLRTKKNSIKGLTKQALYAIIKPSNERGK